MKKAKLLLKTIICIYAVYCLIFEFEIIKSEINDALTIWINVIIPSVFPYLVLSQYISNSDITACIEKTLSKIIAKIFRINPCCIKALICSLLCGYPSGAISSRILYEQGALTKDEAKRLVCFTNNAGPLFLISAVGGVLLGSVKDGFALYVIQHISSLSYGILSSQGKPQARMSSVRIVGCKGDLCSAIRESVTTIINICGFMIMAYVMSGAVMIALEKLSIPYVSLTHINVFIRGLFEISSGVKSVCMLEYNSVKFAIICAFVSWSGLSVIMQIKSVGGDIVSFRRLIIAKAVQAVSSFCLGFGYKAFFTQSHNFGGGQNAIKISLLFSMMLFMIYIFKKTSKKAFR